MVILGIVAICVLLLLGICLIGAIGGTLGGLIVLAEPIIAGTIIFFIIRAIVRRRKRH